jgi:hypothetical protein
VEIDLLNCKEVLKSCAHSGIFTAGIYLYMKMSAILCSLSSNKIIDFDEYSLVFSGHSLGGATS